MKKFYILFFVLTVITEGVFAQNSTYNFNSDKKISQYVIDYWTKNTGLPTNSLIDICQTDDGYIWISSYNGLIRFNGIDFQVFDKNNTPAIKENGIGALAVDKEGTLWMTTQSSGLISYRGGEFQAHFNEDSLRHFYSVIYIDNQNRIWAASPEAGWFVYKDNQFHFLEYSTPLENIELATITQDKNGLFWFGTSGKGLFSYENSKFTNYSIQDGLISNWINVVYPDKNNLLWLGSDNGLCTFDGNKFTIIPDFNGISVNSIVIDDFQNVWIGTRNGLFFRRNNSHKFEQLSKRNGLKNNYISELLIDRENSFWLINHRGGLTRIKDGKFTCYGKQDGLMGTVINAICEIDTNHILVGADNGKITNISNNELSEFQTKLDLSGKRIRNIFKDSKKNIWISTYSGLLKIFPNGNEKWFSKETGFPGKYIRLVFEDSQHNIWVGTRNKGLIKINDDESYTIYDKSAGMNVDLILSIDEDLEGNLLVGTSKGGLHVISNGEIVSKFTRKDGLTDDVIFNTYTDIDGKIWLAVVGGLNCLENGVISSFPVQSNVLLDTPFDILEDDSGNFWMPCSKGVMKVRKQDLFEYKAGEIKNLPSVLYDKYDGIKQSECTATAISLKAEDGQLWFPMLDGVTMIDPKKIPANNYVPPVYVEKLLVDNELYPLTIGLKIDSNKKRFIFTFNALSYYEPKEVLFQYKLEGFENEWGKPTKERTISYTNLSHGKYTFKVIACNNDGVWNKTGASFSFVIEPHFYETSWFYLLVVVALILFIYLTYKLRIQHLKKSQKRLEEVIKNRTVEIVEKNEKLLQQQEEINATSEALSIQNRELEQSYANVQLLSEIGQKVASKLSVESIIETVYENVNRLMDAQVFAIGIVDKYNQSLNFHGTKENGKTLAYHFDKLENKNALSVYCYKNSATILLKDFDEEITNFLPKKPVAVAGELPESLIYLPLGTSENKIGVISVQSFKKAAYSDYHLNILRNIAVYTTIALENANAYLQIKYHHNEIKSSVNYASTIQNAILPAKENMDKLFDNFIFYRPKDIVSGDFYWVTEVGKKIFVAVVDCTGHGVPGAFMSMIGSRLLNEIVNERKILETDAILEQLNIDVRKALRQDQTDNTDGMDVCLCRIEKNNRGAEITFTGSKRPLFVCQTEKMNLLRFRGDKKTIGGRYFQKLQFTQTKLSLEKGDMVYLTTDGYIDQNNKERKNFTTSGLLRLLKKVQGMPLSEQRQLFEDELDSWQGEEVQRDDITIMGIRI